jgi:hypothetical protein
MYGCERKLTVEGEHTTILAGMSATPTMPIQSRLLALQWLADLAKSRQTSSPEATPELTGPAADRGTEESGGGIGDGVKMRLGLRDADLQALVRNSQDSQRCVRLACAEHLLRLVEGGGRLVGEVKGRLVAMAAERLSDLDAQVASKWLQMLSLLARDAPYTHEVSLPQPSPGAPQALYLYYPDYPQESLSSPCLQRYVAPSWRLSGTQQQFTINAFPAVLLPAP